VLCAVDVHYEPDRARAACAVFADWSSPTPDAEWVIETPPAETYVPGQFFRRELPPLLALLRAIPALPDIVVIDGYVWLDAHGTPGLGARVHASLGIAVVGVAKTPYRADVLAARVVRGGSTRPLFVSAVGFGLDDAADGVRRMHGDHRIPVLLKRTDQLARGLVLPLPRRAPRAV
jgi:deoxyribonuclease V